MGLDYSKFSTDDLKMLQSGNIDYSKMSTDGLRHLQEGSNPAPTDTKNILQRIIDFKAGAPAGQENVPPEEQRISGDALKQVNSVSRGAVQGATANWADEATAGAEALKNKVTQGGDLSDLYGKSLNDTRTLYKQAQKDNPGLYGAGEFGGGLASTFVPGIGLSKEAKLLQAIGSSAALSGLSAAGEEEGSALDKLKAIPTAAAIGGGVGALGYGLAKGAQRLAPGFAETATGATGKELENKFQKGSGEELLKRGTVGWFDTPEKIAEKAGKELSTASNRIGESLKSIDDISKDQIMANLFTERAKLQGNEGNRKAIQMLDREIEEFSKSPKMRNAQDIWDVKKAFEDKVNWLAKKTKPGITQANEKVAGALRNAVTDVASSQSPELAQKFTQERKLYSLFAPVKEAAEREAATLNQRKIGGMLDTAAGLAGAGYGASHGDSPLESLGKGLGAAASRRLIVPRLPSFLANLTNNPGVQEALLRGPTSTYLKLLNKKENQ